MLAFLLTGVGTAMLGATLPIALREWHLSDQSGGFLLLAAWGGSTAGALVAAGTALSASLGLLLSAAGLLVLSVPGLSLPLPWYLLYGLGLGITMTSLSLLRAREVRADEADVELNRLNLLWAMGACLAPVLALHALHVLRVAALFRGMALAFGAVAAGLLTLPGGPRASSLRARATAVKDAGLPWAPLAFCLFAAAAVGLESAIGSWLTTYTERQTHGLGTAVSASAAFWAGLLLSRAAHSVKAANWLHTGRARAAHVALTGAALALLLLAPGRVMLPLAALLCGAGLGPLYPVILSIALPRFRSTAMFVLAGMGAALVPWLTGVLSFRSGSLRLGLLAGVAAFAVLAVASVALRRELTGEAWPQPQPVR